MDVRLKGLIAHRDQQWTEALLPRAEFMVKELVKLKKHDNWRVRLHLVSWAQRLLDACSQ
jgi:hypothetical protein